MVFGSRYAKTASISGFGRCLKALVLGWLLRWIEHCGNGDGGEMEPEQGMLQNINRKDYFGIPRNPVPSGRGLSDHPLAFFFRGAGYSMYFIGK